ncbi:hypothetical protein [Aeromonas rivipollensis]|uniref:hypothetical protein n=1 Tax=Aeromonas rivipollensis TaxID=948519 RepID=UPI0013D16BA5|nr:hypothetical protein [Aeromonas rivipollensis]
MKAKAKYGQQRRHCVICQSQNKLAGWPKHWFGVNRAGPSDTHEIGTFLNNNPPFSGQ